MFKPVFNSYLLMTICYNVPENQLKDQHIPSIKMQSTTAIPSSIVSVAVIKVSASIVSSTHPIQFKSIGPNASSTLSTI